MRKLLVALLCLGLVGCATWPCGIEKNRKNLMKLEVDMSKQQVVDIMGEPYNREVYKIGEAQREKRNKYNVNAELMRALLQEIGNNRIKCQTISTNQDAASYLESYIWDRIRTSDVLYRITTKNPTLYQRIIAVYMGIQSINLRIAANISALDGFIRSGGLTGTDMMNKTYGILREGVITFLPQLTDLENALKDFLIAERFFGQPKSKA